MIEYIRLFQLNSVLQHYNHLYHMMDLQAQLITGGQLPTGGLRAWAYRVSPLVDFCFLRKCLICPACRLPWLRLRGYV